MNVNALSPWYYPTEEDVLDVNFNAIVSDCRGIIRGTLTPRPWADISGTWNDENHRVKNRKLHNSPMPGSKERSYREPRTAKNYYKPKKKTPVNMKEAWQKVRRLTENEKLVMRALRRMGIPLRDARNRAIELFGGDNGEVGTVRS